MTDPPRVAQTPGPPAPPPSIRCVAAYFGRLPAWMPLFLRSCQANPDIHWLLWTDAWPEALPAPANVEVRTISFDAMIQRIQAGVDTPVRAAAPYKLCDFRPAFGDIFAPELRGYDFWGHCDLDVLFGDLRRFLTPAILGAYDKVLIRGHFALYRNNDHANRFYQRIAPGIDYRPRFADPEYRFFDEWHGIYHILQHHGIPFYNEEIGADINPERYRMDMLKSPNFVPQVFTWRRGRLFQEYWEHGEPRRRELAVIHFQRRRMRPPAFDPAATDQWALVPDGFVPLGDDPLTPAEAARLNPARFAGDMRLLWRRLSKRARRVLRARA